MLLLASLLALAHPIGNQTASPTTWAALEEALAGAGPTSSPASKAKRAVLLLRFAHDEDPPLLDRLKAARATNKLVADADPRRLEAALLVADLCAVAGRAGDRRAALKDARAVAKKRGLDKARRIDDVLSGEAALARLVKSLGRRRATLAKKGSAPAPTSEAALAAKVQNALPAWLALGDERQHAAARIALADKLLLDGDAPAAERALSDAVDALGNARDHAAVRADGWRALSRIFEAAPTGSRWEEAASAALAADRAAAVDPRTTRGPALTTSSTASDPRTEFVRSKDTARLCKGARAQGVSCAKIERARWGDRTYYDFSSEKRGAGFDVARADDVLAEYESELHECLKQGAKANLTTDTHVELVWTVGNDGRVPPAIDLNPLRLRGTLVETCVQKAFARFRYPPYAGELQHVRLAFDVGS